jgi:biopolymer transport protein ExbD
MLIKSQDAKSHPSIEMTPMIDMVFLLLIFFLVATTFHQTEREMQIALPFASSSGPISVSLREIVINVNDKGDIFVGGRTVTEKDLGGLIAEAVALNPEQKVTVRGDRNAVYARIATVLDLCKQGGVQEPYLDTVPTS